MTVLVILCLVSSLQVIFASSFLGELNLRPDYEHEPFLVGVASADPVQDSVLIWTRFVNSSAEIEFLSWYIWEITQNGDVLVGNGTAEALKTNHHTVTVDVGGLKAGTSYHYKFKDSLGRESALGTTKTLKDSSESETSFAILSCTSLWSGYFNAYLDIARRTDIDFVIHLGDYIYPDIDPQECNRIPRGMCRYRWWNKCLRDDYEDEPSNGDTYLDIFMASFNCTAPRDEIAVERYRWVHELYLYDPAFRAARQNHPFIVVVDDHDTDDGSDEFADGLRAFLEYAPTRLIRSAENNTVDLYRLFSIGGDLLDLIVLDTRTQVSEESLLGADQNAWVQSALANSSANERKWRVIAQTKMFMPFALNNIGKVGASYIFLVIWGPTLSLLFLCVGVGFFKYRRSQIEEEVMILEHYKQDNTAKNEPSSSWTTVVKGVKSCWGDQTKCSKISFCLCSSFFILLTITWIVGVLMMNSLIDESDSITYLDDNEDGWGGRYDSQKFLFTQLEEESCDDNNIFISGDMHMSLAADVVDFIDSDKSSLLNYNPKSENTNKRYGVEFLPTSGSRGNIDEKVEELTDIKIKTFLNTFMSSVANFAVEVSNPHFRYFEGTEHGYGILQVNPDFAKAEFWYNNVLKLNASSSMKKSVVIEQGKNRWTL